MLIDCDRCTRPGASCTDCLIGVLRDAPDGLVDLAPAELRAIEAFELAGFEVQVLETPAAPAPARIVRLRRHVA